MVGKNEKKSKLRKVFEKNTNLITVFGIFNAFIIFSQSIEIKELSLTFSFIFSILSIIVIWEIIGDFFKLDGLLYRLIAGSFAFIQLGMIGYLVLLNQDMFFQFIFIVITFTSIYLFTLGLIKLELLIFKDRFSKSKNLVLLYFIVAIFPSVFIAGLLSKVSMNFLIWLFSTGFSYS